MLNSTMYLGHNTIYMEQVCMRSSQSRVGWAPSASIWATLTAHMRASPMCPYESQPCQSVMEATPVSPDKIDVCSTPPWCYALWNMKQTNKHDAQYVISTTAVSKPCLRSEQGTSTTIALNHSLTIDYHKPIGLVNFVCLTFIIALINISGTFSFVCPFESFTIRCFCRSCLFR